MTLKNTVKKIMNKVKKVFVKTDVFREHCEDELAKVLDDMANYTTLDELKAKLVQTSISIALSYTPVVGGISVALTSDEIETLSKEVIKFGHKAEKLMANQLAKH